MAKPTAPLLSFGASGTLAKTMVFSKWKGRPYVRRHVVPANPRTVEQLKTRNTFSSASDTWKLAGPLLRAPWDRFAVGQVLAGRNKYMADFVQQNRGQTDLLSWFMSPGAKGGLPAASLVLTTVASLGIEAVIGAPALPTGWAITQAVAVAILDQDPQTGTEFATVEGLDAATPFQVDLVGLTAATWVVGAWFEFTKADLTIAFGVSLQDSILVTV
ncbi:MAG: hypothetical protein FVQ77_17150 [Cytophagales bacterium]|nr:hypothetical protein [Cytophagales bacterium]